MNTNEHINSGGGICGTCASPARATSENQGYSDCCNDRIEYGDEATETAKRAACSHTHRTEGHPNIEGGYRYTEILCADCGALLDESVTPV